MALRELLNMLDEDIYWIAKEELNLLDRELLSIKRDRISITLCWSTPYRNGTCMILKNTIVLNVGGRNFYVGQKSVDYLVDRFYCVPKSFFYDARRIGVEDIL